MQKIQGFTQEGNTTLSITGAAGTIAREVQGSYPGATITVYAAGTLNLSTIYSDDAASPTAKANPFVSDDNGQWSFYVSNGSYDVKFSGAGIAAPFTIGDIVAGLGDGGAPSYAFASLPTSKSQNAGDLANVTTAVRGLYLDTGVHWAQVFGGKADLWTFGALLDGTTDDTAAYNAAAAALASTGGSIYLKDGVLRATSALTLPASVHLEGANHASSKILKDFNGDLFASMPGSAKISGIWLDGRHTQGRTGRLIVISTGNSQIIRDSRLDNCESYCIEYSGALVGSFSQIVDCPLIGGRDDPYVAIKLPDDEDQAAPRTISNVNTGGAVLVDVYRSNNTFISGGRNNGIIYSSNTGAGNRAGNVLVSNMRIGGSTAHSIAGEQCIYFGVDFGLNPVTFTATSSSCQVLACLVPSSDFTDLGTGNRFDVFYKEYTPTWTQASGTQPDVGNGTIRGTYSRFGNTVMVQIRLTMGGSSTFGNNGVGYRFSLPFAALALAMPQFGSAYAIDANSNHALSGSVGPNMLKGMYPLQAAVGASEAFVTLTDESNGSVRSDSPAAYFSPTATWQTSDTISIALVYVAA